MWSRCRPALGSLILLVLSSLCTSGAHAQETDLSAQAQADFQRGRAAYDAGRLDEARAALRHSLELRPYLATAYNLAVVLEAAGDYAEAASLCARILEDVFGRVEAGPRADVEGLLVGLDARIGRIAVRVAGATESWLRVDDGEAMPTHADGALVVRLSPGEHSLEVGAEGIRPQTLLVHLVAGQERAVRIDLSRPATGELAVSTDDSSREVEIVEVARARGSVRRSLPVGVYDVMIVGLESSRRSVAVQDGELTTIELASTQSAARDGDDGAQIDPGVWVAIALVAAALAGGAVALAVALTPAQVDPDPVFGVVMALSY